MLQSFELLVIFGLQTRLLWGLIVLDYESHKRSGTPWYELKEYRCKENLKKWLVTDLLADDWLFAALSSLFRMHLLLKDTKTQQKSRLIASS